MDRKLLKKQSHINNAGRKNKRNENCRNRYPTGVPGVASIIPVLQRPPDRGLRQDQTPVTNGRVRRRYIHLLVYGKSTEANYKTLEIAHEICLKWAAIHGATFAPQKYEMVHLTRSPKKFNMTATVDLGSATVKPETAIRVLGLHIDGKLKWGPHVKKVRAKMASQGLASSMVAASTWGATLNKARQVYSAVVRPAMTYAAATWHTPRGLRDFNGTNSKHLGVIQNGCLRKVLGAYRATSVNVLEAEAEIAPMQTTLDMAVLRNQATRGTHSVTKIGNSKIRRRLRGKRGQKRAKIDSPTEEKEKWALRALRWDDWGAVTGDNGTRNRKEAGKAVKTWGKITRNRSWKEYQGTISEERRTPAQEDDLKFRRKILHQGLAKAESSALTQMRTGKIGLAHFLYTCRVPGIETTSCECGWRKQDAKHILLFCPLFQESRQHLVRSSGTNDFRKMMKTPKGAKASTQWLIQTGLLGQFSLAQEQLYGG